MGLDGSSPLKSPGPWRKVTLFLTAIANTLFMPIIVQMYVLTVIGFIILTRTITDIRSDRLLRKVLFILAYAGVIRLALGLDLPLPTFFHDSIFLAYALFAPGAYLSLRNFIGDRKFQEYDLIHLFPFLTLCIYGLFAYSLGVTIHPELSKIW